MCTDHARLALEILLLQLLGDLDRSAMGCGHHSSDTTTLDLVMFGKSPHDQVLLLVARFVHHLVHALHRNHLHHE